jgi:myosin heavy subunit
MDFNQAYEKISDLEKKVTQLETEKLKLQSDVTTKIIYNQKLRDEFLTQEKDILKKIEVQANQTGNKGLFMRIRWLLSGFDGKPFITLYR